MQPLLQNPFPLGVLALPMLPYPFAASCFNRSVWLGMDPPIVECTFAGGLPGNVAPPAWLALDHGDVSSVVYIGEGSQHVLGRSHRFRVGFGRWFKQVLAPNVGRLAPAGQCHRCPVWQGVARWSRHTPSVGMSAFRSR